MPRLLRFLPNHSPRVAGIACVMVSILVWSGWLVISSYSVRGNLTAYDLTFLRFTTAAIVLFPLMLRKGLRVGPWGRWGSLWLALMMGAAYNTICILGMKFAPTSHTGLIQTTVLVLGAGLGVMLLNERFTRLQTAGVAVSIGGVFCLFSAGDDSVYPHMWLGHALFMLGGAMWAVYTITMRKWKADPVQTTAAVCWWSAVLFLPFYLFLLPSQLSLEHWGEATFQALYQGVLNSVIALLCYNRAVAYLGASTSSAFLPLIPVLASLLAIPALGEVPTWLEWTGMAFAGVGVLMATGVAGRLLTKPSSAP